MIQEGSLDVASSDFTSNTATNRGGALYIISTKSARFTDVLVAFNLIVSTSKSTDLAHGGGGVYLEDKAKLDVWGSTFASNTATNGGAFYLRSSGTNVQFSGGGNTFTGNEAENNEDWYGTAETRVPFSGCPRGTYQKLNMKPWNTSGFTGCPLLCPAGKTTPAGLADRAEDEDTRWCTEDCPAKHYCPGITTFETILKCPEGSYSGPGSFRLSNCSSCTPGTVIAQAEPLVCESCPAGRFQPGTAFSSRVTCRDCPAGRYLVDDAQDDSEAAAAAHDAEDDCRFCARGEAYISPTETCSVCPAGTYQDVGDSTAAAVQCKICPGGRFLVDAGVDASAHANVSQCKFCAAGTQFVNHTAPCTVCAGGRYQDQNSVPSAHCKSCAAGTALVNNGSNAAAAHNAESKCIACEAGAFTADSSVACAICPGGYYVATDRAVQCKSCVPGKFNNDKGETPAKHDAESDCDTCPPGQISREGDTFCFNCPAGWANSSNTSAPCRGCPVGRKSANDGITCLACEVGKYQSMTRKPFCLPCIPGKFQQVKGKSECDDCPAGRFQNMTGGTACYTCPVGKRTPARLSGASSCELCLAGKFGSACESCPPGRFRAGGDPDASQCNDCPRGFHQNENGSASCFPCVPGRFQPDRGSSQCKLCEGNTFSNTTKLTSCHLCAIGKTANKAGSTSCASCDAGKFGASCAFCAPGQFRAGYDADASKCRDCPSGFHQNANGSASCLPCVPGRFQLYSGSSRCKLCEVGYFSNMTEVHNCYRCRDGESAPKKGQTQCLKCAPGKFQDLPGQSVCHQCARGRFRADSTKPATKCDRCKLGQSTNATGSSVCFPCDLGKFGRFSGDNDMAVCSRCPVGTFQDDKGTDECKTCPPGEVPNFAQTTCLHPTYKTPKDCSQTTQYLDDSPANPFDWVCRACPLGAYCQGLTTWRDVRPKFGWFRIHINHSSSNQSANGKANSFSASLKRALAGHLAAEADSGQNSPVPGLAPPDCLLVEDNKDVPEPKCAFAKCIYSPACLGAANEELQRRFLVDGEVRKDLPKALRDGCPAPCDLARLDRNESCDTRNGYANECWGGKGKERCRLCATCLPGYKRFGGGAKCKPCPNPTTNRALLAVGFIVMVLGSAALIYMTVKAEGAQDEASDAAKKILLNNMQLVSLASGLPLQWPDPVENMFSVFNAVSSAGSNLLVPDCELTHLRPYEAFYGKQIVFTFIVPAIIATCLLVWGCIRITCAVRFKLSDGHLKNYAILSVVLLLFLCYPMLVKLCLSMLKCPYVGNTRYLMSDLQEPCFAARHTTYALLLTLPQLLLYVLGLPLAASILIVRTKAERRWVSMRHSKRYDFKMRYGLLYLGYREERAWYEVIIALRKVVVVSIGTFGTLLGVVDVQAFVALAAVFASIVTHLLFQPFETSNREGQILHNLEFAGLVIAWATFWGGLIFFLGPSVVSDEVRIFMSVMIVLANVFFLLYAVYVFGREFIRERRQKVRTKRETMRVKPRKSQIAPAQIAAAEALASSSNFRDNLPPPKFTVGHTRSALRQATIVHEEFRIHELRLQKRQAKRSTLAKRNLELRVIARLKVRQSRALAKVQFFSELDKTAQDNVLKAMTFEKRHRGDLLCRQGDSASEFYIIVAGECSVFAKEKDQVEDDDDSGGSPGLLVATLGELQFFGESAISGTSAEERLRGATVIAASANVQLLKLHRADFDRLVSTEGGALLSVASSVAEMRSQRILQTRESLLRKKSKAGAPLLPLPTVAIPPAGALSQAGAGTAGVKTEPRPPPRRPRPPPGPAPRQGGPADFSLL